MPAAVLLLLVLRATTASASVTVTVVVAIIVVTIITIVTVAAPLLLLHRENIHQLFHFSTFQKKKEVSILLHISKITCCWDCWHQIQRSSGQHRAIRMDEK
jgi:hypothetical protein